MILDALYKRVKNILLNILIFFGEWDHQNSLIQQYKP